MLCQNCGKNEATIHLYATVNGQRTQLDYCQSCYQKIKNQQNGGLTNMAQNDPFGFGSLDDLFVPCLAKCNSKETMSKHRQHNLAETTTSMVVSHLKAIQKVYWENTESISQNKLDKGYRSCDRSR